MKASSATSILCWGSQCDHKSNCAGYKEHSRKKCPRVKCRAGRCFQPAYDTVPDRSVEYIPVQRHHSSPENKELRQTVHCQQMFSHVHTAAQPEMLIILQGQHCKGTLPCKNSIAAQSPLAGLLPQPTYFPLFSAIRATVLPLPKHNTEEKLNTCTADARG